MADKPSESFSVNSPVLWSPKRCKVAVALASGYTQKEAAEQVGITDRTVRDWLQNQEFAEEVDRLSLMVSIASRAERLRLAMRVIKQKTSGNLIETKADLLEWLKFAQSETDGANLNLLGLAAKFADDASSEPTAISPDASPMARSGSGSGETGGEAIH